MENIKKKHANDFPKEIIGKYKLQKISEENVDQHYSIEYSSACFVIKIEKYFREFYATVYKTNKPDSGINIFNLLSYLRKNDFQLPKSNYFIHETDIEVCYSKQLSHIFSVFFENYGLINDFFQDDNYELNITEFEQYWRKEHPELYYTGR